MKIIYLQKNIKIINTIWRTNLTFNSFRINKKLILFTEARIVKLLGCKIKQQQQQQQQIQLMVFH